MTLTNAQKQRRRREALDEIAAEHGYSSHYKMMTAIVNKEVLIKEITDMFKIGDIVKAEPYEVIRDLSKGAIIDPPRKGMRAGVNRGKITGFLDNNCVEVQIGGFDYYYVPADKLELIERTE